MGQFQFELWLAHWYAQASEFSFEWDAGNMTKSVSKHAVTQEAVESVFELKLGVTLGRQISPRVDEERICIVGPSLDGRMISVVFTLRSGHVRPISSRPAKKKERKLYETLRKTP